MSRTTKHQLDLAFARLQETARGAGLDPSAWALVEGSRTYGRAYRLVEVDASTGGQSSVLRGSVPSYLGMTRGEAYEVINFAGALLHAVATTAPTARS